MNLYDFKVLKNPIFIVAQVPAPVITVTKSDHLLPNMVIVATLPSL